MRLRVRPVRRLEGSVSVPGDKSISHRAALLGALASGTTEITGFLEAEDCLRTLTAIEALGAEVSRKAPGQYRIAGAGLRGLREPENVIDCGNSGTTARLLMGVLAGQPFWTVMTGDDSLRQRPMGRVAAPLRGMGVTVVGRAEGTKLPLAVRGADAVKAVAYASPMASAQVKSAVLLAGLYADSPVSVTQPALSRDHTERMLRQFGVEVTVRGLTVAVTPGPLHGAVVAVPGDISSAAFLLVAGLIVPEGRVTVEDVGVNPTRTGLLDVLLAMEARIGRQATGADPEGGEPRASLTATSGALRGTAVGGALIPRLIDEVPALAVAALVSIGRTVIGDAGELRVKESDRIAALGRQLGRMGARIEERPDGMVIEGGTALARRPGGERGRPSHGHGPRRGRPDRHGRDRDRGRCVHRHVVPEFRGDGEQPGRAHRHHGGRVRGREPVIAIDGPAGAGKSTAARLLARRLGYRFLDTGSMYRAVAWSVARAGIPPVDGPALRRHLATVRVAVDGERVRVDGRDVTDAIRTPEISALTSQLTALAPVREKLTPLQRDLAAPGGAVLEGRDTGTVVCPDAEVKFYLDASLDTRARRRQAELAGRGVIHGARRGAPGGPGARPAGQPSEPWPRCGRPRTPSPSTPAD